MKKLLLGGLLCCVFVSLKAQVNAGLIELSKVPELSHHYQEEYTFDKPVNPEKWKSVKAGLNAAFGTTDVLYLRTEVPDLPANSTSWDVTGWKGERVNAQLLVWAPDSIEQVRVVLNDLQNENGQKINKENLKVHMIRYVLSNFPYNANALDCGPGNKDSAYLMPDRFESFERFDHPGGTVRPVWLSVSIPASTQAGNYRGAVIVKSEKQEITLNVNISVQNQVLSKPADWSYRLDLWQNPWVVAWYYQLEPWSDEHMALLKKHMQLYADAGGKYITTYTVHSPWSDNSYMIEGTMVDWIKKSDGSWTFDYTIFDKYVELAMETGVDEAITIYTPVPWEHRFRYMDEKSGNYVYEKWSPDTKEFKTFWNLFLDDLKAHLEKKGWFKKTYLGINENPLDITKAAAKVIKDHSADWRITYAGDWHAELTDILDDYSPIIGKEPSAAELKHRKSKGFTTTYYVCCTPPKPNNFVFSPPVESRYISWYASAYGYDGFLRWAYDAWPQDPNRDARHTLWPAGDCFLVYPGGNTSIRFEKLREGIIDFEKIRILREMASKSKDKKVTEAMKELEKHLATFVQIPDYHKRDYSLQHVTSAVHKGQELLRRLSELTAAKGF